MSKLKPGGKDLLIGNIPFFRFKNKDLCLDSTVQGDSDNRGNRSSYGKKGIFRTSKLKIHIGPLGMEGERQRDQKMEEPLRQ